MNRVEAGRIKTIKIKQFIYFELWLRSTTSASGRKLERIAWNIVCTGEPKNGKSAFIKLIVKWATQFKDIPPRNPKMKNTKVPQIFVKAMQVRNESGILPLGRHRMIRQMENLDGKEVDGSINTLPSSARVISLVGASESKMAGVWVPEIRLIIYSGCGPTNLALSVTLIIQWDKSKYTQICM